MDERAAAALVALIAYILWRRGVISQAWAALWGASDRRITSSSAQTMIAGMIGAGATSDAAAVDRQTAFESRLNTVLPATGGTGDATVGNPAVVAAEPAGLAATIRQYGSDLYNWCLAFVNKTRQAAGLPVGPYGAQTAAAACSQLQLHSGQAPAGATVCFSDAPGSGSVAGHIGIADGGDSYTSAGLVHGGIVRRPYLHNPQYIGFAL
jgi:hypothetical protein